MNYKRLAIDIGSLAIIGVLIGTCTHELPNALDKAHVEQQTQIIRRCMAHGDYNMVDAYCAAAAKEKDQ